MAVVTVFSVAERFLGFIYRIFLSRHLGAEGVGIYQIALTIFGVLITVTASGIPITVSRLIIKHKARDENKKVRETITSGICTAIIFSLPISLIFILFGNKFSFLFSDKRCLKVLMIIIPSLIINSIYAVIRGSFWGNKNFFIYSLIEFLEEVVMLISGILMIKSATDMFDGVTKASYAVLISYAFSFLMSVGVIIYQKFRPANPLPQLKPLITSALPITAMRTTTSIINSLIAIILPARLIASGLTSAEALACFGEVSGMAIPMLFIPSSLIGSIALVLVPELSENYYKNDHKTLALNIQRALKYSILIACIIMPIFASCGKLIGTTIYSNQNAGKYLIRSAFIMLPMSISMITTSILNSLGNEKKTLLYYFIGESGLIFSIYFLPKLLGAESLIAGYYFSFTVSSILNLTLMSKKCKEHIGYKRFLLSGIIFLIPSTILGVFLKNIFSTQLPAFAVIFLTSLFVTVFNILFYFVFGFIKVKIFFKKRDFNNRTHQATT